jgi:hypothetical protein
LRQRAKIAPLLHLTQDHAAPPHCLPQVPDKNILTAQASKREVGNVRFGSKADMTLLNFDVRFTLESGHSIVVAGCPLWANNGLMHRSKRLLFDHLVGEQ